MDSLYRQAAPKPFNKFPYGYRPIVGSLPGSSPASPQKSFGSLSSILSTYDNYARNLPNPQESTINGAISLSELNRTYPGPIEPPIPPVRAGSLDPESDYPIARNIPIARPVGFKDDTVYVGSAVSSRAGSPMRATFSPSSREGGSQRSIYSPATFDIGSPEPRSPPNYSNQRNFRYNHHQYEVPPDANTSFENSNYDNYYTNENQSYPNYIQQNVNPYHQQPPVYHQNYSNQGYYENQNHQNNRLNHDAYAYSNGANRRADEFLEKLRRHKDELERSLNQPRPKDNYYRGKLPYEELLSTANTENPSNYNEMTNSLPLDCSTRNDDYFDDRHMSYGNSYNNRPQHQPLHKTVSDPAVQPHFSNSSNQFQTLASPRRSQNPMTQSYDENFNRREDFEGTYPMSKSAMASTRRRYGSLMEDDGLLGQSIRHQQRIQEITDNDIRPKHQNHVSDNDLNQKGGFFASKLIDANWMVDPPPPIDINPRNPGSQRNQTPGKPPAYDVLRESNEHRRSQIPTPSSYRDRINQPATIDENRILRIYDPENLEDLRKRRSQLPVPTYHQYRNAPQDNQAQLSPLRLSTEYQENRGHQNQTDYYGPPQRQSSYQEMPFKEKLPSPRYNSAQNLQQNRFDNDYGNSNPPPLITTYRNPAYQRSQDQSLFGPVESKIFEPSSPTIINGFTTQAQPTTKLQADDRQNPGSSQNSARTFALVSRVPEDTSKLMQPLQIQPESRRYGNRPGYGKLPDLSPTSVYDNDATDSDATRSPPELKNLSNTNTSSSSEEDQKGYTDDEAYRGFSSHQSRSRIPQLRNERINSILREHSMQPARSRSPNGILKKGTGQRSNKKVVFQCEPEISSKQLGFRLENLKNGMLEAAASAEAPPHVRAFDDAIEEPLRKWYALSDQLGGDVTQVKSKVESVFADLRNFLWTAAGRAEPAANEVQNLLAPIVKGLGDISAYKDTKRNTPMFNHLSAVAEGVPAVGWVLVKKTPAPYVKEMLDAAMFYVNRILKEFKDGNQTNVEWAKAWKELLETMQTFVRQTHTTGLVWNSAPGSVPEGGSSAPKPSAGGPAPPPPPPPPADIFADIPKSQNQSQADKDKTNRDALFAQLNKGEAVTAGLKKVTSDMQTHKNPSLRASSTVSGTSVSSGGNSPVKSPTAPVKKPPKTELQDGKTWIVEYHVGNPNIIIDVTDKKQTVYVFKCENSVVKVNGKLNSITLDQCKKTSVVFDALVAQCETINCQSVQIQTLGEMPTLSIQKTDGCQVYLSEAAKNAEIVTSKSSEMNILIPVANDDYQEFPVPEQFKTTFKNGKLHTEVSDIC